MKGIEGIEKLKSSNDNISINRVNGGFGGRSEIAEAYYSFGEIEISQHVGLV